MLKGFWMKECLEELLQQGRIISYTIKEYPSITNNYTWYYAYTPVVPVDNIKLLINFRQGDIR